MCQLYVRVNKKIKLRERKRLPVMEEWMCSTDVIWVFDGGGGGPGGGR